jgi:hypothetical protein
MTTAPTPPPHVFTLYLNSGGSAFFSKKCQALLIKAALNPDNCGSYSFVAKTNADARKKCEAWDSASPADRAANNIPQPTPQERYLSDCESGHLIRDSNFRTEGGRGEVCESVVDGFESNLAPCVPHQGRAADPATVHGVHTLNENSHSANQRARNGTDVTPGSVNGIPNTPGGAYPPEQRRADEDARTQPMLDRHKQNFANSFEATTAAPIPRPGSNATERFDRLDPASQAAAIGAKAPTEPNCAKDKVIGGNTAAACLNNWRKKAEAAMYKKCKDDYPRNAARATPTRGGPPPTRATHRGALEGDVAAAEATHGAKSKQATTARAALSRYDGDCCRADMGRRMIDREQRRTGHAA